MKKNSLLKGASLLFSMCLISSCSFDIGKFLPFLSKDKSDVTTVEESTNTNTNTTSEEVVESEFSCRKAREAVDGVELTVEGIVAKITTNDKQLADGFILIDDFASIYVYGPDVAQQVTVGNKVKVKGTKAFYVLEAEKTYADKFGYKGSNQINASELLFDDEKNHELPTRAIENTTVKQIMNTPASEDITTKVFRVPAYIKRSEGQGFINYYIDDLDGKTGSYVYTKSNGADIDKPTALRPFDGKKVLMYVTPINAKSSSTGCVWRFIPVDIIDPEYDFPMGTVPEFALEYYVKDQFLNKYNADPALEVLTSVSNDIIPFENVSVSYSSSDTSVVSFTNEDDKLVMHTGSIGSATISATATYTNGKEYTSTISVDVEVEKAPEIPSISVKEAQESELNSEVTVKGVVASSLVNQAGFYLIDDTGVIAVKTSEDIPSTYSIGDEVIIKAKRDIMAKQTQSLLSDAQCLVNNYGNHKYSKAPFATDKTITEVAALPKTENHSFEAYTVTAQISKVVGTYSTNYYVTDDPTQNNGLGLYASSGNQYSWLDAYVGVGTVSIDLVVCNWNGSGTKGCIVSVTDSNGTTYNTLNFKK